MIDNFEVSRLKSSVNLQELASRYTTLKGNREKFGSCPRCGGKDRFHVLPDKFFCRNCLPPKAGAGRNDHIDFLRFVGEVSGFIDGVDFLRRYSNQPDFRPSKVEQKKGLTYFDEGWQKAALEAVKRFEERLQSADGAKAREYLLRRGLYSETCEAFSLGFTYAKGADLHFRPAITIPWFYKGIVTAVQYRFIDDGEQRYSRYSYKGYFGETVLFTAPLRTASKTLIIREGELNALSIWQESDFDVVSIGSQNVSGEGLEALKTACIGFDRIFLWLDDKEASQRLKSGLEGRIEVLSTELDPNDMLQKGELGDFLEMQVR